MSTDLVPMIQQDMPQSPDKINLGTSVNQFQLTYGRSEQEQAAWWIISICQKAGAWHGVPLEMILAAKHQKDGLEPLSPAGLMDRYRFHPIMNGFDQLVRRGFLRTVVSEPSVFFPTPELLEPITHLLQT